MQRATGQGLRERGKERGRGESEGEVTTSVPIALEFLILILPKDAVRRMSSVVSSPPFPSFL